MEGWGGMSPCPGSKVGLFLGLLLLAHPLDGLHQPHHRGRGDGPAAWRGGGSRGGGRGSARSDVPAEGVKEDWAEERQVANLLEQKIIRKVSMKRWLEERHKFFPTPSSVERLKVDEGEELREKVLAQEGWQPSKKMSDFLRPQRTRWEETARKASAMDMASSGGYSSCPSIDLDREAVPGSSHLWSLGELRGGGGNPAHVQRWWREMIDGIWEVELPSEGPDTAHFRFSLSGLAFDCVLASYVYLLAQFLVDLTVAVPAVKLVTSVLFPQLLPSLNEFPQVDLFPWLLSPSHPSPSLQECLCGQSICFD